MEGLGDSLPRAAAPACQLLLGERDREGHPGFGLFSVAVAELDQAGRDTAERVRGAKLDALAISVPEAAAESAQQRLRSERTLAGERPECFALDRERLDSADRCHRARARLPIDDRELPDEIARVPQAEHDLPALGGEARNLHAAAQEQHHLVVLEPLVQERGSVPKAMDAATGTQRLDLARIEHRQERVGLDAVFVHPRNDAIALPESRGDSRT